MNWIPILVVSWISLGLILQEKQITADMRVRVIALESMIELCLQNGGGTWWLQEYPFKCEAIYIGSKEEPVFIVRLP